LTFVKLQDVSKAKLSVMSSNWNKACVGSLHTSVVLDDVADDKGTKDGLDVGILEGPSDDDGPVDGFVESDGLDDEEGSFDGDEEGSLDGVLSTQQMRRKNE
jgi:hypothetical protein